MTRRHIITQQFASVALFSWNLLRVEQLVPEKSKQSSKHARNLTGHAGHQEQ
jgi:hypothetical protein